jgi:hypothetical protein
MVVFGAKLLETTPHVWGNFFSLNSGDILLALMSFN